ncbi:hypothetical protein FX988_00506 [Paraglaciecola mesophila]|uniref:DUF2987 domain-containing protein n=1 Tax=Paraglaciecola mesophila TaxID=197222 RepID=A0A857JI13_9ALTE|nr:DUF2987 domain-containing protein [Paraglaciecola mesophila]QHJ10294.1 hypothetical protein FX988_00506 [Paraglaciecola mesophila]
MKKWLLAACVIPSCLAVAQQTNEQVPSTDTLNVEYSSFYSHVRKLDNEETSALQFAFGFKRVQSDVLCTITKAYIHTQKLDIPLKVSQEQRFTVPSEKALKMAKAEVVLAFVEPKNQCDMSVQLETKPKWLKTQYSANELTTLFTQYQTFFDDMGSFLSFLMPSVDGLVVHFTDARLNEKLANGLVIEAGTLHITKEWINRGHSLTLPDMPLRITASTTK